MIPAAQDDWVGIIGSALHLLRQIFCDKKNVSIKLSQQIYNPA
jgi:hypothetical protein